MKLWEFADLDVSILAGVLAKQVARWDETWGSAQWRRENNVNKDTQFWETQNEARVRAGTLAEMFREEQKRRERRAAVGGQNA